MKFIDGFWLLKHGVKPYALIHVHLLALPFITSFSRYYALQVVQTAQIEDGYNLQVSTKPIRHRGDTLGGPLLSIKVHSPTEGVIGVKTDHFKVSQLLFTTNPDAVYSSRNIALRTCTRNSIVPRRETYAQSFFF